MTLDCKIVRIFAYSSMREQSNKRSRTRQQTESETGACEARALRALKTLTPRFADFFTDFEKKPTVLQSSMTSDNWILSPLGAKPTLVSFRGLILIFRRAYAFFFKPRNAPYFLQIAWLSKLAWPSVLLVTRRQFRLQPCYQGFFPWITFIFCISLRHRTVLSHVLFHRISLDSFGQGE